MTVTVIIATHNRAGELRPTLASLARVSYREPWDVIVVDNNSTDETPEVVREMRASFPVECRYLFEPEPGKYAAMNTAIAAATGDVIACTDDDSRVPPDWLDLAVAGLERHQCDYVGGKVLPIWGAPRPAWLPNHGGIMWSPVALLDFGPHPVEFGRDGVTWPLGINMATRREAFIRVGPYDNRLGRKAGTLRNQAQREWQLRARSLGLRGFYLPEMVVHHVVPAERLRKSYFRRWLYWHGISRAILYDISGLDMEDPDYSTRDFRTVPHVLGVPRYMYRSVLWQSIWKSAGATLKGDPAVAFENELRVWFFAGMLKQRVQDTWGRKGGEARRDLAG